jgi:hypothetical protein
MNWFKSLWLKIRLPNRIIPPGEIFIPLPLAIALPLAEPIEIKRTRKKKEIINEPTNT